MIANLYLAYSNCADIAKHIDIDGAAIIGFDADVLSRCTTIAEAKKSLAIIPRKIVAVDSSSIGLCLSTTKNSLAGCMPKSVDSARRLAKIGGVFSTVLTLDNRKAVDESQVNFMSHSPTPKYIEVHLYHFVSAIASKHYDNSLDLEKEFYRLGNVIERALKLDVGVIPVGASPSIDKTLLAKHIDVILFAMGFSKRERRLMLEVYPADLVTRWLRL